MVRETWLGRVRRTLGGWLRPWTRGRTDLELTLQGQVERLEAESRERETRLREQLEEKTREVQDVSQELEQLRGRLKVQEVQITELAAVIARNLERVKAETAIEAQRIAIATVGAGKVFHQS